ncbi:MAG: heparinase II/III family protein [Saprospiraceae bacterium]
MVNQLLRYYHTVKYLKWIQFKYRLIYLWKSKVSFFKKSDPSIAYLSSQNDLKIVASIPSRIAWEGENRFNFLNIEHQFKNEIDWNFSKNGKLWTYNLNYFEFLDQPNISKQEGLNLIHDFIQNEKNIKDGMESFPISLRVIFWIKFLIKHQIRDEGIDQSLQRQLQALKLNLEYHLLGNHLLENSFGLLFGAVYFDDDSLLEIAKRILFPQLEEQILLDGAHYELSPMYHQLILFRILDSVNLLQKKSSQKTEKLLSVFRKKAELMLAWLTEITWSNGDLPRLNDSASAIAPTTVELQSYAKELGLQIVKIKIKECGYRKFSYEDYEAIVDVGQIGPDYIPGHAHSDTFNIVLHFRGQPILVDVGISTYEKNKRRHLERSTASHNTVMIDGKEQSEIWGGFRVARRAKVIFLEETSNRLFAIHDGYQRIKCQHQRTFIFGENDLQINDKILGGKSAMAFFHFHPDIQVILQDSKIQGDFGTMQFENHSNIYLEKFQYANGFNQLQTAQKIVIHFKHSLNTKISFS